MTKNKNLTAAPTRRRRAERPSDRRHSHQPGATMIAVAFVVCNVLAVGAGLFIGWLIWADRAGTYYIPKSLNERSGWIHDGTLYVASGSPTNQETHPQ